MDPWAAGLFSLYRCLRIYWEPFWVCHRRSCILPDEELRPAHNVHIESPGLDLGNIPKRTRGLGVGTPPFIRFLVSGTSPKPVTPAENSEQQRNLYLNGLLAAKRFRPRKL